MTYHNKLLAKKILKITGITLLIIFLLLLLFFTYIGRYLVFNQTGAHLSISNNSQTVSVESEREAAAESPVLVTGSSLEREVVLDASQVEIPASEVRGIMIDYATLSSSASLRTIELSEDYNTLLLEMRVNGSNLLQNEEVDALINRAKKQGLQVKAVMSCLDDNQFALANPTEALRISGGALWVSPLGYYCLNPGSEKAQQHIIDLINQLADRGFDEVILERFEYPLVNSVVDGLDNDTRTDILCDAYHKLVAAAKCPLGILVTNADNSHQAFFETEHVYVYFPNGSYLLQYASYYENMYVVYLTGSHDTRFNSFGKITVDFEMVDDSIASEAIEDDTGRETENNDTNVPDEAEVNFDTNETPEETAEGQNADIPNETPNDEPFVFDDAAFLP